MTALAALQAAEDIFLHRFRPDDPSWLSILRAVLNQRPFPALLIQGDLSVNLANAAASRETGADLVVRTDRGLVLHQSCQRALGDVLRESPGPGKRPIFPKIIPYDAGSALRRMLAINPLEFTSDGGSASQGGFAKSWFILSLRSGFVEVRPDCIGNAFGLTRAESALAAGLAQGLTLQEYAARQELKISTVRWHLQNIFERTETRSQAELVGLIVSLFG